MSSKLDSVRSNYNAILFYVFTLRTNSLAPLIHKTNLHDFKAYSSIFNQTLNKLHLKVFPFLSSSLLQGWMPVWEREARLSSLSHISSSPSLPPQDRTQRKRTEDRGRGFTWPALLLSGLGGLGGLPTHPTLGTSPSNSLDAGEAPPSHHLSPGLPTLPFPVLLESPNGKSLSQGGSRLSLSCWPISRSTEHRVEGPRPPAVFSLSLCLSHLRPAQPLLTALIYQIQVPATDAMLFKGSI